MGNVHSGKSPSGKCPVGKVSVGELSFGEMLVWDLSKGKCQTRNHPDTNLSAELSHRNFFKELYKRAMTSTSCKEP